MSNEPKSNDRLAHLLVQPGFCTPMPLLLFSGRFPTTAGRGTLLSRIPQAVVIGTWPRDPGSRCIDIGQ
jgi:hypothetical protein